MRLFGRTFNCKRRHLADISPTMQLSFYHVTLGVVAMLAVICKVYGSDAGSHIQGDVRKRIFCNFYGCGSKRSAGNKMASDLGPLDADVADVGPRPFDRAPLTGSSADDDVMDMASQEAAFLASQKILRAAAMWEALREKLRQDRGHQRYQRNAS